MSTLDLATTTAMVRRAFDDTSAEVTLVAGVVLPGLALVSAKLRAELGGRITAIVTEGGEVLPLIDDAAPVVMRALGPEADATVVAQVIGTLESGVDPTWPVLTQAHVDGILREEWRVRVTTPKVERGDDGARVFEYWVRSNKPPLWRSRLTVDAHGSVTLARTVIWSFGDDDPDASSEGTS
jgi:hypothetical protein